MKKVLLAFAMILLISAAFGQETVTLPAKPANPRAGRVLELREVVRISDVQGGFYFKGPSRIQAVPDGGLLVADDDELPAVVDDLRVGGRESTSRTTPLSRSPAIRTPCYPRPPSGRPA